MRKKSKEPDDDLRPEYDFSKMRVLARGPKRKAPPVKVIHLEPDVAKAFPDDESVNETLRLLMRVARNQNSHSQSKRRAG
ncbi:MAG TPA: hypothetical protein VN643_22570 [Pyrinomonadaceae bacterium]|nr:hypothetical protein [Pyrinomonadaceae bacterium]